MDSATIDARSFWNDLCREMRTQIEALKAQSKFAEVELKCETFNNNFGVHRSVFKELEIVLDEQGKRVTSLFRSTDNSSSGSSTASLEFDNIKGTTLDGYTVPQAAKILLEPVFKRYR